jgi:hypothetical protein
MRAFYSDFWDFFAFFLQRRKVKEFWDERRGASKKRGGEILERLFTEFL